jgi:hypothetical protein
VVVEEVVDDSDDVGTIVCRTARSLLHDATVRGNFFSGLSAAFAGYAILGSVSLRENTVRNCYFGVGLVDLRSPAAAAYGFQIALLMVLGINNFAGQLPEPWLRFLFVLSGGLPVPAATSSQWLTDTSCDVRLSSLPRFLAAVFESLPPDDDDNAWNAVPLALRRHAAAFLRLIEREMTCEVISDPSVEVYAGLVPPKGNANRLHGRVLVESNDIDASAFEGQATTAMFLWCDECDRQYQLTATSNSFRNGLWWSRRLSPDEGVQPPIG